MAGKDKSEILKGITQKSLSNEKLANIPRLKRHTRLRISLIEARQEKGHVRASRNFPAHSHSRSVSAPLGLPQRPLCVCIPLLCHHPCGLGSSQLASRKACSGKRGAASLIPYAPFPAIFQQAYWRYQYFDLGSSLEISGNNKVESLNQQIVLFFEFIGKVVRLEKDFGKITFKI